MQAGGGGGGAGPGLESHAAAVAASWARRTDNEAFYFSVWRFCHSESPFIAESKQYHMSGWEPGRRPPRPGSSTQPDNAHCTLHTAH